MKKESKLLLRVLLGLGDEKAIKFDCEDREDARRTSNNIRRFISDSKKSGKLDGEFSVLMREQDGKWMTFVVRKN